MSGCTHLVCNVRTGRASLAKIIEGKSRERRCAHLALESKIKGAAESRDFSGVSRLKRAARRAPPPQMCGACSKIAGVSRLECAAPMRCDQRFFLERSFTPGSSPLVNSTPALISAFSIASIVAARPVRRWPLRFETLGGTQTVLTGLSLAEGGIGVVRGARALRALGQA
jgi:hypothetical protein